jgi:hypothetical protein
VSLAEALEAAAGALPAEADLIRPANGDAARLLAALPSEGARRVAAWLVANRAADAEELAEVWCEEPAGQAALLAVDEGELPKDGRKLLRRLRHRLRSRGVATPEASPAPTVARLGAVEEELRGAFVSGFDPMGARQVWWLEPNPGGGTRLFECVIDDARGVLGFDVYSPTRSDLRRFLKGLSASSGFPTHAVEPAAAKALLLYAAQQQASDRPAPKRWVEWRGRLGNVETARLPGDLVRDALGSDQPREALDAAVQLLSEGRVGPWPPLRATLTALVERFRSALDSALVVSSGTRREQVARLVEEAAGECFSGAASDVAAHRFREAAFGFWRSGDEGAARACLAAAAAFESQPGPLNLVARAFIELWLKPLLNPPEAEAAPAAAAEPPLLVRP